MTVSFDTLSFAKRLTEAGEKPAVAEAHAPSSSKMALKEFVMETVGFTMKDEPSLLRKDIDALVSKLTLSLGVHVGGLRGRRHDAAQGPLIF